MCSASQSSVGQLLTTLVFLTMGQKEKKIENVLAVAQRYAELYVQKQRLTRELQEAKDELEDWATEHKKDFKGIKSLTLENGVKLCFTATTGIDVTKSFSAVKFLTRYPNSANIDFKVSLLKPLLAIPDQASQLKELGVQIKTKEKFEVKLQ